jgi:iron(III) transport system substrate-binding protein
MGYNQYASSLFLRTAWVVIPLLVLPIGMLTSACTGDASAGSLIVYSGRSENLVDPIIRQFAQETGIAVSVKYASTPQLAATLLEEGIRSPADVFFAQEPGGLGAVRELLSVLPASALDRVPDWAKASDGTWVGVSGRARTLVYGTEEVSETALPSDIEGLTDPRWKGRLGWAPTNASFQTMVTAMRVLWGEERTREWLGGIQANKPQVYPNNTSQLAAVASGEIDIGMVNHYYLHRFLAEEGNEFPARNYHVRNGGPGALVMVAGVGVLSTAGNRESAELFVEFLLSIVTQQYFTNQTFEYPVVMGVGTTQVLKPLEEINQPSITPADLADLEETQRLLRETGILP